MKKNIKIICVALCFMLVFLLCACDASIERSVEGSWKSAEGYIFTFDGKYLSVVDPNGEDMLENSLEYRVENGIMTFTVSEKHIDMFYFTVYADTLRLEYTEPVLEYLGEEVIAGFTDRVMVLERIEK